MGVILVIVGIILLILSLFVSTNILDSGYVLQGKTEFILDAMGVVGIILIGVGSALIGQP